MKTIPQNRSNRFPLGLYPTFKEWKLYKQSITHLYDIVYILPLRNENYDQHLISLYL